MENFNLFYKLVDELEKRFPQKNALVNVLTDLLLIEKESVYRRLRKEIPFTLAEAGVIAREFNISLDELMFGANEVETKYLWESYEEYYLFDKEKLTKYNNFIKEVTTEDSSEAAFIMNTFDPFFFSRFDYLTRFVIFKWMHKFCRDVLTRFEDIKPDEEYLRLKNETAELLKKIDSRCYIIDPTFISNFINDIHYFESAGLIERESIESIKRDLFTVLDHLQASATAGQYIDTKSRFELYVANISIGQSCSYIGSEDNFLSVLISFELLTCSSQRKKNYEAVKNWFKRVKGLSTQISVSADKERFLFFNRQRALIENL
jgi:hypothetical protein